MDHYKSLAQSIAKSTATSVDKRQVKMISDEVLSVYSQICGGGDVPDFDLFSDSDWEEYYSHFEYITETPEYNEILRLLSALREDNNVVSLYIGHTDIDTMKDLYLVDASVEGDACAVGHCDDTPEEFVEKMKRGDYDFQSFITNYEEYGWLCSAQVPIRDDNGEVIGQALVDISMNDIMAQGRRFLYTLTLITLIMALVMVLLVLYSVNRAMLNPINKLSAAASLFVAGKKENLHPEDSEIAKLQIKTGDEIEKLAGSIKQMEKDLNTYITDLTNITAEKERIGAELDVATHIQSSILPCVFPAFPERNEFDIYASMTPAKEVGGDFYDFFMVDDRNLAIVMADVSGKGVPAALFMVIAKTLIKDHSQPDKDLGEVFTKVNNLLCESNSEGLFVTAFEGVLDLVTGEFNFVNAGHEPPYIYKPAEGFNKYKVRPGFVLAGMEDVKYRTGSITIDEGDKIFLYTDGVTEATDARETLYGHDRLKNVLNNSYEYTPQGILDAVKTDIDNFVGYADQFDDITMLCLEYKKSMNDTEVRR
ncbi:MAG: SpoIIE family protein phosphatase [Oscillospiraceae bacterium]|nr:SpoIIE family protein phosphatase [Oscillospiraceae bacterium]